MHVERGWGGGGGGGGGRLGMGGGERGEGGGEGGGKTHKPPALEADALPLCPWGPRLHTQEKNCSDNLSVCDCREPSRTGMFR